MRLSVVLDCRDPHALVGFWSAALGYRHAASISGSGVGSGPGYEVLIPADGEPPGSVFVLQAVAEAKAGKNRMHLDVHAPLELGVPALVERLEGLGGRRVGDPVTELLVEHGIWWQVMQDPEGNELCVVADPGHPAPG
jgi:hypothetical protein